MTQRNRRKFGSIRGVFQGTCGVLLLAAACGSNPELTVKDDAFSGLAGLGDACTTSTDCQASLLCGNGNVCVGACGELTGNSCGTEACLADGRCSQGLGRNCTADKACTDGLKCSELGHCATPCEPGTTDSCKGNKGCRDDGTCPTDKDIVIGGIGGAGNGTGGEGAGGDKSCIDVDVGFTPQIPTVLLLIDRSGSMNASGFGDAVDAAVADGTYTLGECPDDNDWRWNVVRDVLMNPTKGIVKPLEDKVRFGMSLYTSDRGRVKDGAPEEVDPTKMCPLLINVPIALNNHGAMLDQFKCSDIADDTPTGESLQAAADTLKAFSEPGPKVIVLATDGEPDSCECPNFDGPVPAKCKEPGVPATIKQQVVAIAKAIHDDDVTVHVINVSKPSETALQQHLTDVADAGGGKVYPGFSPGALSTAFEEIINGARPCTIDLNGEIAAGKESTGVVKLDGAVLGLDDPDGWQVNSPSQIELLGEACETIKTGDHDLSIKFPCESFDPVVH
ncbi:MAG TPA: vWA domain-containing protein [Polyangiaceae bacterium]|nr:vWA domain-containing protein [Polyangiaceae bacterium]